MIPLCRYFSLGSSGIKDVCPKNMNFGIVLQRNRLYTLSGITLVLLIVVPLQPLILIYFCSDNFSTLLQSLCADKSGVMYSPRSAYRNVSI